MWFAVSLGRPRLEVQQIPRLVHSHYIGGQRTTQALGQSWSHVPRTSEEGGLRHQGSGWARPLRESSKHAQVRKAGSSCAVNPQARGCGLHYAFVEQVSEIWIAAVRLKASVCKLLEGRHVLPLLRAIPPETHNPRNFTERRVLCRCARSYRKGNRSHNNDGQ